MAIRHHTYAEIGEAFGGRTKQRGEQLVRDAMAAFRYEWNRLTGEEISEHDARLALCSAAVDADVDSISDDLVEAFCSEWLADVGRPISPEKAREILGAI